MQMNEPALSLQWPAWRKIIFRFFFVYLFFQVAPWSWLRIIPGVDYILGFYDKLINWMVETANAKVFHVRQALVPLNGSGDTSYGWAQTWLFISLAGIGCILWSLLDRKRAGYNLVNYWLCLFTRYYIAMIAFSYGILKLFAMQMYFPNLSQLATPLGDFLPMRLSWMFIGYSSPYQVFSGVMEVIAGVLLLYRRTTTFGVLFATTVFLNVMMLNLCYDIPVKIYSMHIVVCCLFLAANEWKRILNFFILNRPAAVSTVYSFPLTKKWMRIARIVLKIYFIGLAVAAPFYNYWQYYKSAHPLAVKQPIPMGLYDVHVYVFNKDTVALSLSDTMRWRDLIFDKDGLGSIKTADTAFRQRYKRGYFYYKTDSVQHSIRFSKLQGDSNYIFSFRYEIPDSNTLRLWGRRINDSLFIELKKNNHHFQLAEKQFHWLSESNR